MSGNPLTNEDLTGQWCIECDLDTARHFVASTADGVGEGIEDAGEAVGTGIEWGAAAAAAAATVAMAAVFWAADAFFFPTYGVPDCMDSFCWSQSADGPASAINHMSSWLDSSTGGSAGSSGSPCDWYCYAPPPPPPPPQDCYAGPNPTCTPSPAPRSLRDSQHETEHPRNTTNPRAIPRGDTITENTPSEEQLLSELHESIDGLNSELNENGDDASSQDNNGNTHQAQGGGADQPATPQAGSADSGSASGGSGGAGNPPVTTPSIPEPPDPNPGSASSSSAPTGLSATPSPTPRPKAAPGSR